MTVDDPAFTANTVFAGSRPTGTGNTAGTQATGSAKPTSAGVRIDTVSVSAVLVVALTAMWMI